MKLSYAGLTGQAPASLRVAQYVGGAWQSLGANAEDASAQTVTGTTPTVGTFALTAVGGERVGEQQRCRSLRQRRARVGLWEQQRQQRRGQRRHLELRSPDVRQRRVERVHWIPGRDVQSCMDSSDGLTASCCVAEGSPICIGVTGAEGCTSNMCTTEAASLCSGYPGSSMTSCTDSTNAFQASCCFPAGKPVCVSDVESAGCTLSGSSSSSSGGAGSGGIGACPPAPTCIGGPGPAPCAAFPGTTVQSCIDSADGYTAACCYPPATLPPAATSGSSSGGGWCVGSSSGSSSGG